MSEQSASSPIPTPQLTLPIDRRSLPTTYTNYFRASGSAEELILDFGLDPQRHNPDDDPESIVLLQRLVLTWGNAKQLARMLLDLLQRYEQSHGPIRRANTNRPPATPPT
jgi:hypothetical protein